MLQDNNIKTFSEFADIDENIVKLLRYRRDTNIIFQLLQYINYIDNNGDYDLIEDPTQQDKKDFIDWENTGEPEFANSTKPHRKREDDRIQSWRIATVVVQKKDKRIVSIEQIILSNSTENNILVKGKELKEEDDCDTSMIHVLTHVLEVP